MKQRNRFDEDESEDRILTLWQPTMRPSKTSHFWLQVVDEWEATEDYEV